MLATHYLHGRDSNPQPATHEAGVVLELDVETLLRRQIHNAHQLYGHKSPLSGTQRLLPWLLMMTLALKGTNLPYISNG